MSRCPSNFSPPVMRYNPKMKLSEKLRLGLPANDPFIQAVNLLALLFLLGLALWKSWA